jgi:hypothetical protein
LGEEQLNGFLCGGRVDERRIEGYGFLCGGRVDERRIEGYG